MTGVWRRSIGAFAALSFGLACGTPSASPAPSERSTSADPAPDEVFDVRTGGATGDYALAYTMTYEPESEGFMAFDDMVVVVRESGTRHIEGRCGVYPDVGSDLDSEACADFLFPEATDVRVGEDAPPDDGRMRAERLDPTSLRIEVEQDHQILSMMGGHVVTRGRFSLADRRYEDLVHDVAVDVYALDPNGYAPSVRSTGVLRLRFDPVRTAALRRPPL